MAYTPTSWVDNVTPVNAVNLNHLEDGVDDAHDDIAALDTRLDAEEARLAVPAPVVNGQWVKGVGGAAVWAAITEADVAGLTASLAAKVDDTEKAAINGVATLDSAGRHVQAGTVDKIYSVGQVDGYIPVVRSGVTGWEALPAASGVPAGVVAPFAGAAAPTGWLLAIGQTVSRTTYADLFAVVGTAYNTGGEAGTDFRLPDLQGRMPVGKGTHTDVDALGENDGAALANRRPKHLHTVGASGSTGSFAVGHVANRGGSSYGSMAGGADTTNHTHTVSLTVTVGPQTNAPTDAPSYLVFNFIIKT